MTAILTVFAQRSTILFLSIFALIIFPTSAAARTAILADLPQQQWGIFSSTSQPSLWNGQTWNTAGPVTYGVDISDERTQLCMMNNQYSVVLCRDTQQAGGLQTVFTAPAGVRLTALTVGARDQIAAVTLDGAVWAQQANGVWLEEIASLNPGNTTNGRIEAFGQDYCVVLEKSANTMDITCRRIGQTGPATFAVTITGSILDVTLAHNQLFLLTLGRLTGVYAEYRWQVSTGQTLSFPVGAHPSLSRTVVSPDGFTLAWDEYNQLTGRYQIFTWDIRNRHVRRHGQTPDVLTLGYDTAANLWAAPRRGQWTLTPPGMPAGYDGPIQLP